MLSIAKNKLPSAVRRTKEDGYLSGPNVAIRIMLPPSGIAPGGVYHAAMSP